MSQPSQPADVETFLGLRKFVAPNILCFVVNFFVAFSCSFCIKFKEIKGKSYFRVLTVYLQGISGVFCQHVDFSVVFKNYIFLSQFEF